MIFNPRDLAYLGSAQSTGDTLGIVGSGYASGGNGEGCYTWDTSTQTLTLISSTFFVDNTSAGDSGACSGNSDGFMWSGNDYYTNYRCTLYDGTTVTTNTSLPWISQAGNGGGQAGGAGDHATVSGGFYKGRNNHATWNGSSFANGTITNAWTRNPMGAISETGNSILAGGYGSVNGSSGLNNCTTMVGATGGGSGTSGGTGSGAYGQISDHCETRGGADRSGGESWTNRSTTNLASGYGVRCMVGDGDEAFKTSGFTNCQSYSRMNDSELWNGSGGTWTTKPDRPSWVSDAMNMGEPDNMVSGGGYGNSIEGTSGQGYRTDIYAYNGSSWTTALTQTMPTGLTRDIGEVTGVLCCMTPDP